MGLRFRVSDCALRDYSGRFFFFFLLFFRRVVRDAGVCRCVGIPCGDIWGWDVILELRVFRLRLLGVMSVHGFATVGCIWDPRRVPRTQSCSVSCTGSCSDSPVASVHMPARGLIQGIVLRSFAQGL